MSNSPETAWPRQDLVGSPARGDGSIVASTWSETYAGTESILEQSMSIQLSCPEPTLCGFSKTLAPPFLAHVFVHTDCTGHCLTSIRSYGMCRADIRDIRLVLDFLIPTLAEHVSSSFIQSTVINHCLVDHWQAAAYDGRSHFASHYR